MSYPITLNTIGFISDEAKWVEVYVFEGDV